MRAVCSSSSLLSTRQTVGKMKKATFLSCFADDTSLSGLLKTDETSYRFAVAGLGERYNRNFLKLNVAKTGKIVVDFRRNKSCISTFVIKDEDVRIVRQYKYIGIIIDDRLEWTVNTEACYKKAHQRMYFSCGSGKTLAQQQLILPLLSVSGSEHPSVQPALLIQQRQESRLGNTGLHDTCGQASKSPDMISCHPLPSAKR